MQRHTMPARPARLVVILFAAAGLAVLLLLLKRRRRRPDRGEDEPGVDIGHGPEGAALGVPDPVQVGGDIPPRDDDEREDDLSRRRRLPPGPYRPAPDEPETEPEEAP